MSRIDTERTKRERRERKEKSRFAVEVGDRLLHLEAYTASEARAQAKPLLGIGRKGRLPVGAKVTRLA